MLLPNLMLQDQRQGSFSDVGTITTLKNRRVLRIGVAFFWSEEASATIVDDLALRKKLSTISRKSKFPVNLTFQLVAMSQFFSQQTVEALPWGAFGVGLFPKHPLESRYKVC